MKLLFDCNAFDFFYARGLYPFEELIANGYSLYTTPEIRKEIINSSKPQNIKNIYLELENTQKIKIHRIFGYVTYKDIQDNIELDHIGGFSTYEDNETSGSMLTYQSLIRDSGKPSKKGQKQELPEAYLNKKSSNTKKINDRLLASLSTYFPVLTCDESDALGKARKDGYKIIYLGKVSPTDIKEGFDNYNGTLSEYISDCLSALKKNADI